MSTDRINPEHGPGDCSTCDQLRADGAHDYWADEEPLRKAKREHEEATEALHAAALLVATRWEALTIERMKRTRTGLAELAKRDPKRWTPSPGPAAESRYDASLGDGWF